ncbi:MULTISPECIES: hypothetical protein [unclassified Streptomyces]|uniref:hypothetical protein n=1 Tax=unclassified Streptomyces TaxID=2593676 RepID=UPI000DAD998A|nr:MULTISPECIES: hypothetical protein [unclassified Streptomyces]PZT76817.1 hypothetical protein DNK56_26460 [Streptomyces sp. AC1-42W]PZT79230.1 hypothetical protein DNK55_06220 [Streptomyces sp. AC1-42T]
MNNTPSADIRSLRSIAAALDAQRGKLPDLADPLRPPVLGDIARQITALGQLASGMGHEVFFSDAQEPEAHTPKVLAAYTAAVQPTAEALSALGQVAEQLAFLDRTEHLRVQPDADDAREAAVHVIDEALCKAHTSLRDTADCLRTAATTISPPSVQLRAALSRSPVIPSATAAAPPSPPLAPSTAPARRGR